MAVNGWIHVLGATVGLISGGIALFVPKLTRKHRWLGYAYLISMLAVNASALTIYRETGEIGAFHVLAVISLITLALGYREMLSRRKRPGWLERHGMYMAWSYIGLVAAGLAQYVSHNVAMNPVLGVIVASGVTFAVGGALTFALVPRNVRNLSGRNRARRQAVNHGASPAR